MAGTSAPLLNEYKQEFFWRRFPQTILGGLRLNLGYRVPYYVYAFQMILFAFPFLVAGPLTLVTEKTGTNEFTGAISTGLTVGIVTLAIHLFVRYQDNKTTAVTKFNSTSLLDDDNQIDFKSPWDIETLNFLIIPRRYLINTVLHSAISGGVTAGSLIYLLPSRLSEHFPTVGVVFVFIIGWLTVCIAGHSLAFATPPEPSTYTTTQDNFELLSLTRPTHVAFFLVFNFVARFFDVLEPIDKWLYVAFCCLPLLWTFGVLPPVNALVPWAAERTLVLGLGGSPMATNLRLAVMLIGSGIVLVVVTFVPIRVGLILSACLGYFLSLDLGCLCQQGMSHFGCSDPSQSKWKWGMKEKLIHVLGICSSGALAGVLHWKSETISDSVPKILTYALIGCYVISWALSALQRVYLTGNVVRNPLYPQALDEVDFNKGRNRLKRLAYIRRILCVPVMPFLGIAILALLLDDKDVGISAFVFALGSVRSLRWVWQTTSSSILEIIIVQIIRWSSSGSLLWWRNLGIGIQLLVVSILHIILKLTILKLTFITTLTITSWTSKKQRHRLIPCILFSAAVLFPVTLILVAVSSVISAPILPLFCVPIFLLAFPRPRHVWPSPTGTAYSPCADSIYYRQLSPRIQQALHSLFASGSLGDPSPGEHFLLRFQDRFAWICVTERGLGYVTVHIKGLELQETSCHTAEAARVDELFECAFEANRWINAYPLNTLHPKDKIFIRTYSDAKNVLTGIIDHPENLQRLPSFFMKSLVWVVMHHLASQSSSSTTTTGPAKGEEGGGPKLQEQDPPPKPTPRRKVSMRKEKEKTTSQSIRIHSQMNKKELRKKISILTVETIYSLSSETSCEENSGSTWNSLFTAGSSFPDAAAANSKRNQSSNVNFYPGSPSTTFSGFPQANQASSFGGDVDDEGTESDDLAEALRLTGFIDSPERRKGVAMVPVLPFPGQQGPQKKRKPSMEPSYSFVDVGRTLLEQPSYFPLPSQWLDIPMEERILASLMADFPHDWLVHVQALLYGKGSALAPSESPTHVKFLLACYALVQGWTSGGNGQFIGPSQVYLNYRGNFPWSPNLSWLAQDELLYSLVKKAYRYGVKLMYDSVVLSDFSTDEEIIDALEDYDENWCIGVEEEGPWDASVQQEKPHLFSLGHNKIENTYTGRVLSLQSLPVHVGQLNAEAVHGQWASLALELIYFTNDDEERYSIQAHPTLLRNLTIQAADPPLGYPIYASGPVSVSTW